MKTKIMADFQICISVPLIDNLLMQFFYIENRKMRLSKKILYQYFIVSLALFGIVSLLKTFYMSLHSTKNLKITYTTPDSLN